ncbi:hypothetical protein L0O74_13845, partial [Bifidobacterium longum]|nr:hypothetical protein [Bifidobacterium longum]
IKQNPLHLSMLPAAIGPHFNIITSIGQRLSDIDLARIQKNQSKSAGIDQRPYSANPQPEQSRALHQDENAA